MILIRDPASGELQRVGDAQGYDGWEIIGDIPDDIPPILAVPGDDGQSVVLDMEPLRAASKAAVWALRDAKIAAGLSIGGNTYRTDLEGKINTMGAALAALIATVNGQPFSVDFTLLDGTTAALDGPAMMGVHLAGVMMINALFGYARELAAAIDAATTPAELDAIDIDAGWPA